MFDFGKELAIRRLADWRRIRQNDRARNRFSKGRMLEIWPSYFGRDWIQ